MEFLTNKQAEYQCGPANALSKSQIISMLKLGKVGKNDVFYDLGSGYGRIVRMAITEGHAKEAIGIENDPDRFWRSIINAKRRLSRKQLKAIYFWCIDMDYVDFSDATIIYEGHYEVIDEINMYKKVFKNKRVKIIKRDLPLVSYRPVAVNRDSPRCWFFLMEYPFEKYKIRNKNQWASQVLGRDNVTMKDVYHYYDRQLMKCGIVRSERIQSLRRLKKHVSKRF